MNGTVLPSSSNAMTAATLLAGRLSAWARTGTGSKSSTGAAAGVGSGVASSVIRAGNLAAQLACGKPEHELRDRREDMGRHPAGHRVPQLRSEGGGEVRCVCLEVDAMLGQL